MLHVDEKAEQNGLDGRVDVAVLENDHDVHQVFACLDEEILGRMLHEGDLLTCSNYAVSITV
ncbi:hypothetical protein JCM15519_33390 [Fundidesulfovibrio butyratiphilus]